MSCPCNIFISYSYSEGEGPGPGSIFTYTDVELSSAGILNGKSYYTFTDDNFSYTLLWTGSQWELVIGYGGAFPTTVATFTEDLDCPGTHETSTWGNLQEAFFYVTTTVPCQLTLTELASLAETQECYDIIVWDLQCKFAQCVLEYFTNLKFGIDNKIGFESLMKKKKALEILLCYNARDILLNTTLYNNITYSQIKQLINKF